MLNLKDAFNNPDASIADLAIEEIEFTFRKISVHELGIADDFLNVLRTTRLEFTLNADNKDAEYVALLDELKRVLSRCDIEEMTAAQMQTAQAELVALRKKIRDLNALNDRLTAKYDGDKKFMRIHKRLEPNFPPTVLHELLSAIKISIDAKLSSNYAFVDNAAYFERELAKAVHRVIKNLAVPAQSAAVKNIAAVVAQEYFGERNAES